MQATHIGHLHAHTLQQIFQHPASHNLEWHNVVELVKHNGTVHEEANGHFLFTISGISETFRRPHEKDVSEIEQVLDIRRFLEAAGVNKDGTISPPKREIVHEGDSSSNGQERPSHDQGRINAHENRRFEQQVKTQEHEQNERSNFNGGDAQAHQQGNRQK